MTLSPLFSSHQLGSHSLPNRIVMAPMTRSRTTQPGDIPNAMMAEYYAQRASAGLIISEATQVSPQGKGYSFTPGIYSQAQINGWKQVTDAVHHAGGRIFLQLWHVGRMSHTVFHNDKPPVAPSALAPDAEVWISEGEYAGEMVTCPTPRALSEDDIKAVIDDYRQAAINAKDTGFDGVEIHAANGYLIDQFLRSTSNQRTDQYGGNMTNRLRFLKEVTDAVAGVIGADHVGVRLAPYITARGMDCPYVIETILSAAEYLNTAGVGYLHLSEADWDDAPQIPDGFRTALRETFNGTIIVAGRYDKPRAETILENQHADLVAFGRPFIANPDLPDRLARNIPLADFDANSLFGGGVSGYSTYPTADING